MTDQSRLKIIKDNPIGKDLNALFTSFNSICEDRSILCSPDAVHRLDQADLRKLVLDVLSVVQNLPAARLLPARTGRGTLRSDLLRLELSLESDNTDLNRTIPLLKAALTDDPDDALLWDQVYRAVTESTPPPRPIASSLQQTPWLRNTSSFANSSEYRKDVDRVLREELGAMYVGLPRFHETYFGGVANLETASKAVFEKCVEGDSPLFRAGWCGWPSDANQDDVLSWVADLSGTLAALAHKWIPTHPRRPLAQPNKPIQGSTGERKMDIGFVKDPEAGKDSRCHWSQILVPGELKSNPSADIASKAWLDLGRYAREVLAAQDTRRFVLGFTLCGSLMRIWEFDRLGGIASEQFDINEKGLQFVSTILAFLWMSEEQLGFDPTIVTKDDQRYIVIQRNDRPERLVIDKVIKRAPCIAGRATTCWKAHREGDPLTPFVIKDSWQYKEREEEGELLREATDRHVINVARYYHHETVCVRGEIDEIRNNVRGGLNITEARNYRIERSVFSPSTSTVTTPRKGQSSTAGVKRSSSQTAAPLPPSKRSYSTSPTKGGSNTQLNLNRVHRRIILRDYGKAIHKASSRLALLTALDGCIEGHQSLRDVGILHRDISINNLMINEDERNASWPSFLIDLDLAIKENREGPTGAKGKTGTRAFMAIGALLGEQHSFMHDLESFFWVLFWICIHYNGPDASRVIPRFDKWNYVDTEELAELKKGQVSHEGDFIKMAEENFTFFYQPLIPWVNRLRKAVFPNGSRWEREDISLYAQMSAILQEACGDSKVLLEI